MQTEEAHIINGAEANAVAPEDMLRAQIYRFLASFLSEQPERENLENAAGMSGDSGGLGLAFSNLARLAGRIDLAAAQAEYHDLFIGVTRGELLPYGSYYLTGFLNEKPLANLRREMAALGIERAEGLSEPEDHISSVLEIMAGMIEGTYGAPVSLDEQKAFFDKHINSWAPFFFKDLEGAKNSVLYAPLGTIGRLFLDIEQQAFKMG